MRMKHGRPYEGKPAEYSPGGILPDGTIYEQIAGEKFAVCYPNGKIEYADTINGIAPYDKVPWNLPSKAQDYSNDEELYEEVKRFIYEHIDLPDPAGYDVLACWVLATWLIELWKSAPYLQFYGPHETGKTRSLEALSAISYRDGWRFTPPLRTYTDH